MSDGIVWATAEYRVSLPGVLIITEDGGVPCEITYPHARDVPTTRALTGTAWAAAPGGTWNEGKPGSWRIRVYRHGTPGELLPEPK